MFLANDGQWVASGLQARGFDSEAQAVAHCAQLHYTDVYLFFIHDNPRQNFAAPENCAPASP